MARANAQLTRDPTAAVEVHRVDDRFVPLRVCDLISRLGEVCAFAGIDRQEWLDFACALAAVIDQEETTFATEVGETYSYFNPDRDTLPLDGDERARTPEGYAGLSRLLTYLLDKANFERLDDIRVDHVAEIASARGLRVRLDPTLIDQLAIHVRGRGQVVRKRRTHRHPVKGQKITLPVYRRLVVIGRLKGDPHVLIKMFKDIPEQDVEALLPHAQVTMNWLDRLLMIGGGVGALGSTAAQVIKIISASLIVLSRLLWVVLFGTSLLLYRTFNGYRRARQQRDSQRTRHLYYQNVCNNAGAIEMLIAMISQEEVKELLLASAMCATAPDAFRSDAELKAAVEAWLKAQFDVRVDFDVTDAVESLDRFGLWLDRDARKVLPFRQAVARLREHWAAGRSVTYHRTCCSGPTSARTASDLAPESAALR